jgi:hypothetical protein
LLRHDEGKPGDEDRKQYRDERGYTAGEGVRQRTTHSDFMHSNMRKKLFPGAF